MSISAYTAFRIFTFSKIYVAGDSEKIKRTTHIGETAGTGVLHNYVDARNKTGGINHRTFEELANISNWRSCYLYLLDIPFAETIGSGDSNRRDLNRFEPHHVGTHCIHGNRVCSGQE